MPMMDRPVVSQTAGGRSWEHTFDLFHLKAYIPDNNLDGQVNNYGFRAPLLLVFEEKPQSMDSAVAFARETGLATVAAAYDTSVLFIHPAAGSWVEQDERLEVLDLVIPVMENILNRNGLCPLNNLKPCVRSCAWYDSVKECCIMRRI